MELNKVKSFVNSLEKKARYKEIEVIYENKNITTELQDTIISARYSDSINELDSVDLKMVDRENRWMNSWKPLKGDSVSINLNLYNWEKEEKSIKNKVGNYFLDDITFSGPPDTVDLKAVSVDLKSSILDTKNNKVWKNISFKKICEEIAKKSKLQLSYNVEIKREYERVEQREESDFNFVKNLADELEINVKLYNGKLVLWEESLMEKQKSICVIKKGEVQNYRFNMKDTDNYKECEVRYHDYKKNKVISGTFLLKKQKDYKYDNERKLLIIQNKSPRGKTIAEKQKNLKKLAAKELKKRNNSALTANISMMGKEVMLYSGSVVDLQGFGYVSGRYLIKSIETDLKLYTCNLVLRACNYKEYEDA